MVKMEEFLKRSWFILWFWRMSSSYMKRLGGKIWGNLGFSLGGSRSVLWKGWG